MTPSGRRIEIRGTVQGVGFRPFVYQTAVRIGITGTVMNDSRGVCIDAFGSEEKLEAFTAAMRSEAPPAASIGSIEWAPIAAQAPPRFTIEASREAAGHRVSIPADLATCGDCAREIFDPDDRRFRHPFTNCTNCGPRYSIVTGAPYDRAKTSMVRFTMCPQCRAEYEDPSNRRFHAQPNACPACGPRLKAMTAAQHDVNTSDAIDFAARSIRAGFIVAVKGLGGFHLACDATSSIAVRRLRERKRRDSRPFAVMVRDLRAAHEVAELTDAEVSLLTSVERPIVLCRQRPGVLASEVSGQNPLVGLFLPYTPLHHLLLHDASTPVVMTSGNLSDEPMVTRNEEAFAQLRTIADVFLVHDRAIVTRVDDSVVRVIDGGPVMLRRARGFVPRAIEARAEFAEPLLACGAHLKNTFCLTAGNRAYLGPHIGDLESVETLRAYEAAIEGMKEFVGVRPQIVAHDLHPDYFSTRYALAQQGVRTIGVQHHHAHVVSVMAEHGLEGPVVGVAYDGTGYGTDGTAWGGEILIAREASFERFATFRPVALPGADQAIRQLWRVALALLDDSFGGKAPLHSIPLFREMPRPAIDAVRRMVGRKFNAPPARGVGRYFDAFAAFILGIAEARHEGELAFLWNVVADDGERGVYPIVVHDGIAPWEIDPRPMVRSALEDLLAGRTPGTIAARFHNTLAAVTVEVARAAIAQHGAMPVALSGGCFQNRRLAESVIDVLRPAVPVFMNRNVPPGDGGIALGQAFVASAIAAGLGTAVTSEVPVCA